MRIIVFALVFAFVGTILAEEMAKSDEPTRKKIVDDTKEAHTSHMSTERKEKIQHKKVYMNAHADLKTKDERMHGRREFLRRMKERMMEIKKSDLPKEEKKVQLAKLKSEFLEAKTDAKNAKAGHRARLTPEERRALIASKKAAAGKDVEEKRSRGFGKKIAGKVHDRKSNPFSAKRGEFKNTEKH